MTDALVGLLVGFVFLLVLVGMTVIGGLTTIEKKVDEVLKLLKGRGMNV